MSECPVPAIARWSVSLLGAQSCQLVNSTQSWHVWVPCACDCKIVCVFAGSTVMSICKFCSIMKCPACPVAAIARWSVSLLGAQSCQFVSSTPSWHVWLPCGCDCKVVCVFTGSTVMSICQFYSIMTCLIALCLRLQGGLCLCWEHRHVNLLVLLNHDMSWVPCACDCKVVFVFAGCIAMSICKFYSITTWFECPVPAIARRSVSLLGAQSCQFVSSTRSWHVLSALSRRLQGVCVFAWYTVMSICKFYSIMTCLSALCLQLQGDLCHCRVQCHVNLLSSTQSWHVWVPCACNCKVVCVFAGSTVLSLSTCKFYSIMTCLSALCLWL